jgi:hypothetical protein
MNTARAMRFAHAHNKKIQTELVKSLLRAGIRFVFSCVGLTDSFDESTSFCTSVMLPVDCDPRSVLMWWFQSLGLIVVHQIQLVSLFTVETGIDGRPVVGELTEALLSVIQSWVYLLVQTVEEWPKLCLSFVVVEGACFNSVQSALQFSMLAFYRSVIFQDCVTPGDVVQCEDTANLVHGFFQRAISEVDAVWTQRLGVETELDLFRRLGSPAEPSENNGKNC